MQFWGSLAVTLSLAFVHITISHWRFLGGARAHVWHSVAAGVGLAYVFAYLLPKLAHVQEKFDDAYGLGLHQAYLLALAGLVTFYILDSSLERQAEKARAGLNRRALLAAVGYGLYNLQLGYLAADLPRPELSSYVLVACILGLHLMGLDRQVYSGDAHVYQRLLRWIFAAATFGGWAIGMFTDILQPTVVLISMFIGGGIIITAIREELPRRGETSPGAFLISVIVSVTTIIMVQTWQNA